MGLWRGSEKRRMRRGNCAGLGGLGWCCRRIRRCQDLYMGVVSRMKRMAAKRRIALGCLGESEVVLVEAEDLVENWGGARMRMDL